VTRTVRRSLAASAATIALLALAGCGGDDTSKASDDTSSSAGASSSTGAMSTATSDTEADTSASADGSEAVGTEISGSEFASQISKALDQATTANVKLTSSAGLNATGQIDYKSDPPRSKMTATMAQVGDIDVILDGKVFYMKGKVFGSGDKWVKIDLSDPNSPMSALGDSLDPAASLEKLKDGIQKATYVGEEGDLKHYSATVDTKALLEGMGDAASAGASSLPATVDYQIWFDGDGNLAKFSVDLGAAGTTEAEFTDWGTDVDITAPPAADVTSMPGM
jgi:hypothetical protein